MSESTARLTGLVLTLTERCNLRCDYCYVPVDRGRRMPQTIADRAVDWFAERADPERTLGLSFFGGEPFLAARQMRESTARLRSLLPPQRPLRVVAPTNALVISDEDLAWCRQHDVDLAISIDGASQTAGRRLATRADAATLLGRAVPDILRRLPPGSVVARMTVTPSNVGSLCANIRSLDRMGFERIVYVPDYGAGWDEIAVALWRREHDRLARWMLAARSAGKREPELPAWKAITARLGGAPRRRCGAGIEHVTVTPDGALYPCHRFAYAKGGAAWVLGDVRVGIASPERVGMLERADPGQLRSERTTCTACPAAEGCTHHCPALGFLSSGDVQRVPVAACRLMQAQVAAVRSLCAAAPRPQRKPLAARPWAKAAALAAAVTGLAACETDTGKRNGIDANQAHDDAGILLPEPVDAGAASQAIDVQHIDSDDSLLPVGGLCY